MVERYTLTNASYVLKSFKINSGELKPLYKAFPTTKLPIITLSKKDEVSQETEDVPNNEP